MSKSFKKHSKKFFDDDYEDNYGNDYDRRNAFTKRRDKKKFDRALKTMDFDAMEERES